MRGDARFGLNCPNNPSVRCPTSPCLGQGDPGACKHLATLASWRAIAPGDQARASWAIDGPMPLAPDPPPGRVRVGLWCPCLGLGGAEAWQLALARAVDPSRVTWMGAAVLEGRRTVAPRMLAELSALMPVGMGPGAARTLANACDVIVSWAVADVAELLAGLDRPPPRIVMACHFPGESAWGEGTSAMLRAVDRFVAVSELALDSIPAGRRGGVEVIWNAVDADRLLPRRDRATMRRTWGIPDEAPVAGYLGRLAPEKDPDAMIRLAAELPEPWRVAVVGEGREREALDQKARDLGLGRRFHLLGGDSAAGDVLGGFDALFVPSRYESFGLTLAEGLWSGLPVIATRSGLAKLVPGLVREIPVAATGPELADALLADRRDRAGTAARVARARAFARDRLDLARFGHEWTDLILDLASAGREEGPCRPQARVA